MEFVSWMPWSILIIVVLFWSDTVVHGRLDQDAQVFLEWAYLNGIEFDSIAWPVPFPDSGRGVAARRNIEDGDVFLKVPFSLVITNKTANGTPFQAITDKLGEFDGVVVSLLAEALQTRESFWWPYLKILPQRFETLESWNDDQLRELQDDDLVDYVVYEQVCRLKEFKAIGDIIAANNISSSRFLGLSFDLFKWAHSVASTRCFEINAASQYALVPFADLLNHHPESPTVWEGRTDGFVMMARGGGFERGTQVYNNYGGQQDNFRMLLGYGFFFSDNGHNRERFYLTKHLNKRKVRLLGRRRFRWLYAKLNAAETLRIFRLTSRKSEDDTGLVTSDRTRLLAEEHAAMEMCSTVIKQYLESRPTSIAKDYMIIHDRTTQSQTRHKRAVAFRIERKIVLHRHQYWCSESSIQVLRCMTSRMVRQPMYLRLMSDASAAL